MFIYNVLCSLAGDCDLASVNLSEPLLEISSDELASVGVGETIEFELRVSSTDGRSTTAGPVLVQLVDAEALKVQYVIHNPDPFLFAFVTVSLPHSLSSACQAHSPFF